MKSIKKMLLGIAFLVVAAIGTPFWVAGSAVGAVTFIAGLFLGIVFCLCGFFDKSE